MEDVRTVLVHLDALHLMGIDIARNVVPLINYQAGLARLGQLLSKYCTVQTGTNNQIIIFLFHIINSFLLLTNQWSYFIRKFP